MSQATFPGRRVRPLNPRLSPGGNTALSCTEMHRSRRIPAFYSRGNLLRRTPNGCSHPKAVALLARRADRRCRYVRRAPSRYRGQVRTISPGTRVNSSLSPSLGADTVQFFGCSPAIAHNTIYVAADHPSNVVLPIRHRNDIRKIRDSAVARASDKPGEAIFSLSLESVTLGNKSACFPVCSDSQRKGSRERIRLNKGSAAPQMGCANREIPRIPQRVRALI